jgi:ABC-type iron transport system FetAB permease component
MTGSTDVVLTWTNVSIGLLFIVFDAILSGILGLGIGTSLMVASFRCILQLSVMSLVLGKVFESQNIFAVAGIAIVLNTLGAIEATFNKAKRRYTNMVSRDSAGTHMSSNGHLCSPS